jgi:hypothetical protein
MTTRFGWMLVVVLAVSVAAQLRLVLHRGPGFATLPIFVPDSAIHEQAQRDARGQPAGLGGEEALQAAEALLRAPLDPATTPARQKVMAALRADRARLLDARNRRHALNIRLMDVGVAVARELTPAQWDAIHMRRDAIRGKAERDLFARLLAKLGGAGQGSPEAPAPP